MSYKRYLDLSKLNKSELQKLESVLGTEKLIAQRGKTKFEKVSITKFNPSNDTVAVFKNGYAYIAKLNELPKYLQRKTLLSL